MNRVTESAKEFNNDDKVADDSDSGKTKSKQKKPLNLKKAITSFLSFFTVEPYIVLYFFSQTCTGIANLKFYVEKACRADLNYPEDVCLKVVAAQADDIITMEATTNSTVLVARLNAWKDPVQVAIPAIFILFVGAWCDRVGNRKAMLLIPLVGEVLSLVGMLLTTYFMLEWKLWVVGIIEVLSSFSGGFIAALTGSVSYLADVSTKETRTFRMGVFFFIVNTSGIIIQPIAGYLTKIGYYNCFAISIVAYIINFIYTLVRIRNVRRTDIEGTFWYKVGQFFHPRNIWDAVSILFMTRGIQLAQIILAILTHLIVTGPNAGEGSVKPNYMLKQFKMDVVEFSLYSTYTKIIQVIGIAIVVTVFSKWLKFHDTVLGIIIISSNVISSTMYGLSPNKYYFFAATLVDIFGGAGPTVIRSMATKVVDQDKVGKMCSLMGIADTMMPSIYLPIFNSMFEYSIQSTFPGSVYILGAVLTSPDFILFLILYYLHRRQQRDVVKHPKMKEMHIYDNDVTSL